MKFKTIIGNVELTVERKRHIPGEDMKKNKRSFSTNKNFKLEYDKDEDILYVTKGSLTKEDTSEELGDDVVIWKNKKTHEVSGFTVLNFSTRSSKKNPKVNLPFEVELHPLI